MKKITSGFTIVELLVVIVIVGILASISVTAYSGISGRARDADRRSDIAAMAGALQIYQIDNGNMMEANSGCGLDDADVGSVGDGSGWFSYQGSNAPVSIENCLINGGYLSKPIRDPSGSVTCGGLSCHAYLKYTCAGGTYLYAHLESLPQTGTETDATCYPTADTSFGINYVVKID